MIDNVVDENTVDQEQPVVEEKATFSTFVSVADEHIEIKKLTASKVATISNIFGELLIKGNKKLKEFRATDNMAFIVGVLAALDEGSLVRLASCLIERDEDFARNNFDLSWVLSALAIQMQVSNLKAVIQNFTSLLSQLQD